MPVSKRIAGDILESIRLRTADTTFSARLAPRPPGEDPLPPSVPRDSAQALRIEERRAFLAGIGAPMPVLTGEKTIRSEDGFRGNIENFIGLAQLPVGLIGPLRINGLHAHGDFYIPLATSEGALVASHARGAAAISKSGGARAACLMERVTRAPHFHFKDMVEAGRFVAFALDSFPRLQEIAAQTTRYGRLEDMRVHWEGNLVYLLCDFSTGEASGQNMVTVATQEVASHLAENAPFRPDFWTVESNFSGDKKASVQAFQYVRGKLAMAEVELPREVVEEVLRTSPEAMVDYWKGAVVAASHAGTIGCQGQYANGLTALFLACGQDVACVAEAAVGTTRFEVTGAGSLYASVYLPNLIVGTVGGGTRLPTARECLNLLGCAGEGSAPRLAEIAAVLALAGELSLSAAITSDHFTQAHASLGRAPGREGK
jgi:hydroxymethylglutaryl-CoA reductase (NADPH)